MKLQRFKVENYKGFEELSLDFGGRSTVLAGVNGVGKSTVLSAIASLMHIWLNRLNPAQGRAFEAISADAIAVGENYTSLECEIELGGTCYVLERTRRALEPNRRHGGQSFSSKQYAEFVDTFRKTYLAGESGTMPIFAHYGVNRSVTTISTKLADGGYSDKLAALERASDNEVNFQKFFEWYREQEANEVIELRENPEYRNRPLELVRQVVGDMVDGVTDIHMRRNPMRMTAVKNGREMRVDLLSDGEKCTIALFGDLVKRLALANPGLEDPLTGSGIVLIDEIELHLHPKWQRRILGQLGKHFPGVQFIVSTHSPQVLGEASDEYRIYFIDDSAQKAHLVPRLDVYDSNLILEEYMGTASQNPLMGHMLAEIFGLVDDGKFESAEAKLESLAELSGYANKDYIVARNYLRKGMHRDAISREGR